MSLSQLPFAVSFSAQESSANAIVSEMFLGLCHSIVPTLGNTARCGTEATYRVAAPTARGDEHILTVGKRVVLRRRCILLLLCDPLLKFIRRKGNDKKLHIGMLRAAKFGTFATINAWFIGMYPEVVLCTWDEIHLACQLRHPEAVYDIV